MSVNVLRLLKLIRGLFEQETPSSWIYLMPFWNPSCLSWKSKFARADPVLKCASANRLLCPVPSPGKWTPSSTGWIRPKRRWPRTSTWCVRSCGRSLLQRRPLLLLLATKRRRPKAGKELTVSSVPDVRPESFCNRRKYLSLSIIMFCP